MKQTATEPCRRRNPRGPHPATKISPETDPNASRTKAISARSLPQSFRLDLRLDLRFDLRPFVLPLLRLSLPFAADQAVAACGIPKGKVENQSGTPKTFDWGRLARWGLWERWPQDKAQRIDEIRRIVHDVGVGVPGLRIRGVRSVYAESVGGVKASETIDVVAHHGIVVAGFVIAFVGGEFPFRGRTGFVPDLAKRKITDGASDGAGHISGNARGKMVRVMVRRCCALNGRDKLRAGINIFARRSAHGSPVVIFGDDFATGEDINGVGSDTSGCYSFYAQTITVICITAGRKSTRGRDDMVCGIVSERVLGVVGHVPSSVVGVRGRQMIRGGYGRLVESDGC